MARSTVYLVLDRLYQDNAIDVSMVDGRRHAKLPAAPAAPPPPPPPPPLAPEDIRAEYTHPDKQQITGAALAPAAEPPALPYVPHFIDCSLKVAGMDITARVTLDMPNAIAREATFRYLVRLIAQIERVGGELMQVAQVAADRDAAMDMAQEEERKRKAAETKLGNIQLALDRLRDPQD